jgi:hypothetical protein
MMASHQVGPEFGVAVISATLITVHGKASHRNGLAMPPSQTALALVGHIRIRSCCD